MLERQWLRVVLVAVSLLLVAGAVGVFVVDTHATDPEPVAFEETVSVGLALEDEFGLEDDVELPKAQVFYSRYRYVVGYYGVETFLESSRQDGHAERFGYPRAVYVTDYSSVEFELSAAGYPTTDSEPEWTNAERASFVVDSEASTPSGETVVPFSDRDDARVFVETYGGTILTWDELLERAFETDDATVVRERVADQHRAADDRVEAVTTLRERPVSTVVGEDAETIQDAIDRAPDDTTVLVPAGTYDETLEIDRPVTLRGDGDVQIRGNNTGTVVTATADRSAVIGLTVAGSGERQEGTGDLPGDDDHDSDWDEAFERNYAGGDAGVAMHTANESLIEDVTIDSEVTGVLLRRSDGTVVQNVTVHSPERWEDGHAGILAYNSPAVVVERSSVADGRDAIYSHRSHGLVVRDNDLVGNRLGIHLMHTSDALLATNRLENQSNTGIYVMTGPERNAIVGNEIRGAEYGLFPEGSDSYVAENRLFDNRVGLRIDATSSIYEHNVVAGNEIGADVRATLPTNRVYANDFVENDVHANAGIGPLRIWSHDGVGNYWQGTHSLSSDGTIDRSYSPTMPVDQRLHRADGTPTLARAPALEALTEHQGTVPGIRAGSIVDLEPTCEPHNPELLAETEWVDRVWTCDERSR